MKNGWSERAFGWIRDDMKRLWGHLQRRETWILIAIAGTFAVIAYYGFVFALKFDFMMRLRNLGAAACREMGNSAGAFLFVGLIFLGLTVTMVFGEFASYLDYKRHRALAQARSAALLCAGWSVFALVLGLAMVLFLHSQCV